jgi:hypothetical protein
MIDIGSTLLGNALRERRSSDSVSSKPMLQLLIILTASLLGSGALFNSAQAQAVQAPIINRAPTSTILPTDIVPLPTLQNRMTFGENMQLRILQKLPARFYFSTSIETTFREETNVFQDPVKRILLRKLLPQPNTWFQMTGGQQANLLTQLRSASHFDTVYRVLPSVTGGWTVTPRTRIYGSFFTIRDSLFHNTRLSTDIYSYSYGIQHDFQLAQRLTLQGDLQFRELNQVHQHSVFDFLPGTTLTWLPAFSPRSVFYVNALMQIRGRKYFQAPTRELDPFYTWGMMHQRGRWSFSASSTLVQDFRKQFGHQALIPGVNSYSMISDFEIDRRIIPQMPGLQAFVRAEPIWNFHTHNRPGLAGMDFRLYYGIRLSMSKPALTTALDSLRRQLEEQDAQPPTPTPSTPSGGGKPSAFLSPEHLTASRPQPIHGFLAEASDSNCLTEAQWISAPTVAPASSSELIATPVSVTQ